MLKTPRDPNQTTSIELRLGATSHRGRAIRPGRVTATALVVALAMATTVAAGRDEELALGLVKPNVDLAAYSRLILAPAEVAFSPEWERRHHLARTVTRVTERDTERIKRELAVILREVLVRELETNGDYEIVDDAARDVLLVRPAIIELDITAPTTRTISPTYSFVDSTLSATLSVELVDSLTGETVARASDHERAIEHERFQLSTASTNNAEARVIMTRWARLLRERLGEASRPQAAD